MAERRDKDNILDFFEQTEEMFRYKAAVGDAEDSFTWNELAVTARRIGSGISRRIAPGSPVPIFMEKSPLTLAAMLGAVYAGCFYVPVNPVNPPDRLAAIFGVLGAEIVITDRQGKEKLAEVNERPLALQVNELAQEDTDMDRLNEIRRRSKRSDILYGIFTSGSTGTPKAIALSHGAVIDFIGHFTEIFGITQEDRLGNQAPFDFDVSVKDIYSSLMTGAELVLIPKEYFSTPPRLLDYLCDRKVTNLTWAVSALTLVSSLKGLSYKVPESVKRVMFSGEAMPPKQLRMWQEALPEARFVNLYGPTEITCNCTYFPVERMYEDGEKIPAGKAFPGREVFLLDDGGQEIKTPGEQGEICVAGESLAEGYYHNKEQTEQRFVMYRGADGTKQRIYRTGDLAYYDGQGDLIFSGRKDFQIKHMGHRIELEEIEAAMNAAENVQRSCCVFDEKRNRITGYYLGEADASEVRRQMKERVPAYMIPSRIIPVEEMPLNKNGKTDRNYFKNRTGEMG